MKKLLIIMFFPVFGLGLLCGGMVVKNTQESYNELLVEEDFYASMNCTTDLDCCMKNKDLECF